MYCAVIVRAVLGMIYVYAHIRDFENCTDHVNELDWVFLLGYFRWQKTCFLVFVFASFLYLCSSHTSSHVLCLVFYACAYAGVARVNLCKSECQMIYSVRDVLFYFSSTSCKTWSRRHLYVQEKERSRTVNIILENSWFAGMLLLVFGLLILELSRFTRFTIFALIGLGP